MESREAYLERKNDELRLLNGCLAEPLPFAAPGSPQDVVRVKFQLTAALRAEHERRAWKITETSWSHASSHASGPFEFSYDYQRADLDVRGPSFYELESGWSCETMYTASGMAAISAVLLAVGRVMGSADLIVLPGSYGETLEFAESYCGWLRLVRPDGAVPERSGRSSRSRVLLLDSCSSNTTFEAALRRGEAPPDLLMFDTTCFASTSARIRKALRWADRLAIPVAMIRSHTKLDSLGAEYGRLGSVVVAEGPPGGGQRARSSCRSLAAEIRNAVRLLGGAAVPGHFPPFVATSAYRTLTRRRVAAMLRNGRRAARQIGSAFANSPSYQVANHGLYLTLQGARPLDEARARAMAERMSEDLSARGLPIRHAGSFGFDFAATEWFHDSDTGQYSVRVAISDLPGALADDLAGAVANWWLKHQ